MKKQYLIFFLFISIVSNSQSIKGKITNLEGIALSDVYIQNIQNKSHAHSNL